MKILVVGGGGREHAIIKKLKENERIEKIYAIPGNGGIAQDAECIAIPANEIEKITEKAVELGVADKTKFIGAVPYSDIDFYYSIGHVFVNASVSETQGLTYLEAMASKKIILAKYDSNLTELIVDGQNGFFYEKKEEFLKKICQIFDRYDTYYNVMVKNMIESVDKLSLKNFYTNIMEVYEKAKRNNI